MKKNLWLFDFDGTITTADTLLAFIRHACGSVRFVAGFVLFSPLLVLMKLHLYPNYKAKQCLFSWYFKGMTEAEFNARCCAFAANSKHLLRPMAMRLIQQCLDKGEQVCIVSASIDNWVRPFFHGISDGAQLQPIVVGTQVEVQSGMLTGRFLTKNCYGAEKVRRIEALFPDRNDYHISAFGDSRGDKEMLDYADERHYRPFR
jgi:phosphatidylglycerophosphatase C